MRLPPVRAAQLRQHPRLGNSELNKLYQGDRQVHDWYRFVLSFPPHLVRDYLERFGIDERHRVLDPFCGTGTTLVECKRHGIASVGIEPNLVAHLASSVKVNWGIDPEAFIENSERIAEATIAQLQAQGIEDDLLCGVPLGGDRPHTNLRTLDPEAMRLLLAGSISPLPLHKTLLLLDHLNEHQDTAYHHHQQLALARELMSSIGNLAFGPEVGVGPPKSDAAVVPAWLSRIRAMADDLQQLRGRKDVPAEVFWGDSRELIHLLEPASIDAVITSPPYPNEKDYTRTTRLESVLLGFIRTKAELRELKHHLIRSNTRNVYKSDDDDTWVEANPDVQRISEEIEARRIAMGKTSGFERMYARVVKLYFGGMARHLSDLRTILRPGAYLAYVVGDQASYLRVMIRTGHMLADIAAGLGYEVVGIDLFRTRRATATNEDLREEVLLLRWPG